MLSFAAALPNGLRSETGAAAAASMSDLVGRDRELRDVVDALEGPGLVVIQGGPGMGRTALASAATAASGRRALEGGCVPGLRTMPGLPLRRAVRLPVPADDVRATAAFVGAIVDDGVLFLDDIQWADRFTLDVAVAVSRRHRVLVTTRPATRGHAAQAVAAASVVVDLDPLDDPTCLALLERRCPTVSDADRRAFVERSGGSPFVALALAEANADTLAAAVAAQISELAPEARAALLVVALLGRPASRSLVAAAADDLVKARLLRERDHHVEVAHAVLYDLVPQLATDEQRVDIHRQLAEKLTDSMEVARHLALAGDRAAAVRHAVRAADQAANPATRAECLRLAASNASSDTAARLWHAAADAYRLAGDVRTAEDAERRGAARAGTLTPREREVLDLIRSGSTSAAVARQLRISAETVETHVKAAMRKLGARTRTEAVVTLSRDS